MNIFLLVLGIILTLTAFLEGLWTTIWVDGNSGPLTARLTTWIWKLMRKLIGNSNHKILSLAGPIILFTTVLVWIALLWLGWSLIFYSDTTSLKIQNNTNFLDFSDVLWYIAFCMFTIGNGDFKPVGDIWQILSSFVGLSGMLVVTLSVTYVLQVISAVVNKRTFASQVTSIGYTAEEFVIKQWNGHDFGAIEMQLNSISGQLAKLNEQHMAFPILHYYHAANRNKSQDVALVILDDALTFLEFGIQEKKQPAKTILASSRSSVNSFLDTLQSVFIEAAPQQGPFPKLAKLTEKGLPTVSEQQFYQKLDEDLVERRKLLKALIDNGAWKWPSA